MQGQGQDATFGAWSQALMALVSAVLVIAALGLLLALVVYLAIMVGSALAEQASALSLRLY